MVMDCGSAIQLFNLFRTLLANISVPVFKVANGHCCPHLFCVCSPLMRLDRHMSSEIHDKFTVLKAVGWVFTHNLLVLIPILGHMAWGLNTQMWLDHNTTALTTALSPTPVPHHHSNVTTTAMPHPQQCHYHSNATTTAIQIGFQGYRHHRSVTITITITIHCYYAVLRSKQYKAPHLYLNTPVY